MGRVQSFLAGLGLALWAPAGPATAQTHPDALHLFATCAGRLSALMEYQWLVQDPEADATEARRDAMVDVLEAAMPKGSAALALDLRLQAKAAEAALLHQALARDGAWALALARAQVADCTALLTS